MMLAWQCIVYGLGALPALRLQPAWLPGLGAVVVNACGAAFALGIGAMLGILHTSGILAVGSMRRWPVFVPFAAVFVALLAPGVTGTGADLGNLAVVLLFVGLSEEVAARGIALELARPLGEVKAAALIAVVFGLVHIGNWVLFDARLEDTIWQIIGSAAFGFALAMTRFMVGAVWPLVLIHAAYDWAQLASPGAAPLWVQVTIMLVFIGHGIALARLRRRASR